MSLQAGTRLGAHEVVGPIGAGGMGEVSVTRGRAPGIERSGGRA